MTQITEQMVDSILNGDKESFMQQFQAAMATKVSDALEVKKVEMASTLIAPDKQETVEVEQEVEVPQETQEVEAE